MNIQCGAVNRYQVLIVFLLLFTNVAFHSVDLMCLFIQGPAVNGSLPVDLLLEEVIIGSALTSDITNYNSITQILREKGLALPKRKMRLIKFHQNCSLCALEMAEYDVVLFD